jgi:hypothetical protein
MRVGVVFAGATMLHGLALAKIVYTSDLNAPEPTAIYSGKAPANGGDRH